METTDTVFFHAVNNFLQILLRESTFKLALGNTSISNAALLHAAPTFERQLPQVIRFQYLPRSNVGLG